MAERDELLRHARILARCAASTLPGRRSRTSTAAGATVLVREHDWEPVDPMRRDFRGGTEGHEAEIVDGDLADIDSCDAVLAAFTAPDEGTSMEAWYAHSKGIRVVAYTGGEPAHPWTVYVSESVHVTLEDAVAAACPARTPDATGGHRREPRAGRRRGRAGAARRHGLVLRPRAARDRSRRRRRARLPLRARGSRRARAAGSRSSASRCTGRPAERTTRFSFHYEGDRRIMQIDALAEPWTPADIGGWVGEAIGDAPWVIVGALTRADFPLETLAALTARGHRLIVDAQGLVRHGRVGPLVSDGSIDRGVLGHITALKLNDEEAEQLCGGTDEASLRTLGIPEIVLTLGSDGALIISGDVDDARRRGAGRRPRRSDRRRRLVPALLRRRPPARRRAARGGADREPVRLDDHRALMEALVATALGSVRVDLETAMPSSSTTSRRPRGRSSVSLPLVVAAASGRRPDRGGRRPPAAAAALRRRRA